jgi:hypothetical protein
MVLQVDESRILKAFENGVGGLLFRGRIAGEEC